MIDGNGMRKLFVNIKDIHLAEKEFLQKLEHRSSLMPVMNSIGDLILEHLLACEREYLEYLATMPSNIQYLKDLCENELFLENFANVQNNSLDADLEGLLSCAQDRIEYLSLQVETIMNVIEEGHQDTYCLKRAIAHFSDLETLIPKYSDILEEKRRLVQLADIIESTKPLSIVPPIIECESIVEFVRNQEGIFEIKREDVFKVHNSTNSKLKKKEFLFFLLHKYLLIVQQKNSWSGAKYILLYEIPVSNARVRSCDNNLIELCFKADEEVVIFLETQNDLVKRGWINSLKHDDPLYRSPSVDFFFETQSLFKSEKCKVYEWINSSWKLKADTELSMISDTLIASQPNGNEILQIDLAKVSNSRMINNHQLTIQTANKSFMLRFSAEESTTKVYKAFQSLVHVDTFCYAQGKQNDQIPADESKDLVYCSDNVKVYTFKGDWTKLA